MTADDAQDLLGAIAPALWEGAPDANLLVDERGRIVLINTQAERMFGYERAQLLGESIERLVPEGARSAHTGRRAEYDAHPRSRMMGSPLSQLTAQRQDGTLMPVEIALSPVTHGGRRFVLAIVRDVRHRRALEEQLRFVATHDALTGLHNRAHLDEELARLQGGRRFPVSLLVADLDGLKAVNDRQGHAAGDVLLQRAARALKSSVRAEDLVARVGGDEFVVVLPGTDAKAAGLAHERLIQVIERQNREEQAAPLALSVGVATAEPGTRLTEALREADERMYAAKRSRSTRERDG